MRWQSPQRATWRASRELGDTSLGNRGQGAGFTGQQSGELEAYSDADWSGDRATRSSLSAGVIMRGRHCLKVWTKKQQVVALSSAEGELYAAVKTASEGLGIQSVAKDLEITCRLNLHLDASATLSLVNRRGVGKAKHVDMQSLWIQEASKSNRFATKIGTNVNPADLMTKPLTKQKIEQLMSISWATHSWRATRARGRIGRRERDDVFSTGDPGNSHNLATFRMRSSARSVAIRICMTRLCVWA